MFSADTRTANTYKYVDRQGNEFSILFENLFTIDRYQYIQPQILLRVHVVSSNQIFSFTFQQCGKDTSSLYSFDLSSKITFYSCIHMFSITTYYNTIQGVWFYLENCDKLSSVGCNLKWTFPTRTDLWVELQVISSTASRLFRFIFP